MFGHSPLVSFYLQENNALKVNTIETVIQHPQITAFPPVNAPTYNDVIRKSVTNIKAMEKNIKL